MQLTQLNFQDFLNKLNTITLLENVFPAELNPSKIHKRKCLTLPITHVDTQEMNLCLGDFPKDYIPLSEETQTNKNSLNYAWNGYVGRISFLSVVK